MNEADILVSGATGRTGGFAIDELLKMGKRVRAYVRTDDDRAAALRQRGVDIAVGISPTSTPSGQRWKASGQPISFIRSRRESSGQRPISRRRQRKRASRRSSTCRRFPRAGNRRATQRRITGYPNGSLIGRVSRRRICAPPSLPIGSSIRILQKEIRATGKIEFPFGNGRHAPIASDDQGRVIAHLLANPAGHEGKIYTLHGPVEMNHVEIAAAMSEVLGTRIEYAPTSIEEFRIKMETLYKFPPFLTQHLVEVAQNYRDGIFSGTNDVVETITGTPPLSVQAFVARNRSAFA